MLRRLLTVLAAIGVGVFCGAGFGSAESHAAEITNAALVGKKIEAFSAADFYGKTHASADFARRKLIVVAFIGTECPLAKLYGQRLAALDKQFTGKSIQFLGIDSNRQDAITEINAYARQHEIKFPILKDLNNKIADQFGATRTPEVFLLDQDRVVRYHGRIDDQYGIGFVRKTAGEKYLESAIEELLADRAVAKSETGAVGCLIGRTRPADATAKVTYSNQIVRILNKNCVSCHREGQIAPFTMANYEEVSGWAEMIAEVVRDRRMPPWHANPAHGKFENDRVLSDSDKKLIEEWVAAGAPQGDPKEVPAPPTFVKGWQLPKTPDKVVYMAPKAVDVPAEGTVPYKYFVVDPGFKEDKWLTGAEAIPGNFGVVHHILVFARPKGQTRGRGEMGGFLVAYAPGSTPLTLPKGYAKRIPAGSELLFQMHYTPNGSTKQTDRSRIGLIFANTKDITHVVQTVESTNQGFTIPAGDGNHKVESNSFAYGFDLQLVELMPHMHLRGKDFMYEVKYPDGKKEVLLDVPHYDFGWQTSYKLADRKILPKGSVVHCVAHFDNSADNLNNPDPKSTVRWGDQTWEEMMIGFYDVAVPLSQEDIAKGNFPNFKPGAPELAQRLMSQFDVNGDGKIVRSEVPGQGQLFFLRLDLNQNGELTSEEMLEAIQQVEKERKAGGPTAAGQALKNIAGRITGGDKNADKGSDKGAEKKPGRQERKRSKKD